MPSKLYLYLISIWRALRRRPLIGPLLGYLRPLLKAVAHSLIKIRLLCRALDLHSWRTRAREVIQSPDNQYIPRVPNAGQIVDGYLIMHNGLRIVPESHYGPEMLRLMQHNRGVHEPQQERAFHTVVNSLPNTATMVELGAYWAFYSLWFHQVVRQPRNLLVEPDLDHLRAGEANFAANGATGEFVHGYMGAARGERHGVRVWTLDELAATHGIERIHLLHADIDGGEYAMLQGAKELFAQGRIDYIFLSTHVYPKPHPQPDRLHADCRTLLVEAGFTLLVDVTLMESFSYDGLLVARRRALAGVGPIDVAKRAKRQA